jgi:hypothetical protein
MIERAHASDAQRRAYIIRRLTELGELEGRLIAESVTHIEEMARTLHLLSFVPLGLDGKGRMSRAMTTKLLHNCFPGTPIGVIDMCHEISYAASNPRGAAGGFRKLYGKAADKKNKEKIEECLAELAKGGVGARLKGGAARDLTVSLMTILEQPDKPSNVKAGLHPQCAMVAYSSEQYMAANEHLIDLIMADSLQICADGTYREEGGQLVQSLTINRPSPSTKHHPPPPSPPVMTRDEAVLRLYEAKRKTLAQMQEMLPESPPHGYWVYA